MFLLKLKLPLAAIFWFLFVLGQTGCSVNGLQFSYGTDLFQKMDPFYPDSKNASKNFKSNKNSFLQFNVVSSYEIPNGPILLSPPLNPVTEYPEKNLIEPAQTKLNNPPRPLKKIKSFEDDLETGSLLQAVENHLEIFSQQNGHKVIHISNRTLTIRDLQNTLKSFRQLLKQNLSKEKFDEKIREKFEIIEAAPRKKTGALITGYYTPVIQASRIRRPGFTYPIYQMPHKLAKTKFIYRQRHPGEKYARLHFADGPNFTRADIDGNHALQNNDLELAWLQDEMDRYFLHIQGSGILKFNDGTLQGVQYFGSNGYPYKSIGKALLKDKVISVSQGSMQGIKKHFREHPNDIPKYVYQNKRYIFFSPSKEKPRGASGVPVVAHRSVAMDKQLYPYGALGFLTARKPVLDESGKISEWKKFSRFVINQDTGSAIKGPGRMDLYFGVGERAGQAAGYYHERGKIFFLLLKKENTY